MGAAGPTTGCGWDRGGHRAPSSCPAWGELGKSGGFVGFIFVVAGGAVRTRRRWGNAAVLAELPRPAGSRKAWTGLGGGRCCFSPSKIGARAQTRPGSAGHTARSGWQRSSDLSPLLHPPPASPTRCQSCLKGFAWKNKVVPSVSGRRMELAGSRRGARAVPTGQSHCQTSPGQGLTACKWGIAVNPPKFGASPAFCGRSFHAGRTGGAAPPWASTTALGVLASQHLGVCCFGLGFLSRLWGKAGRRVCSAQTAQEAPGGSRSLPIAPAPELPLPAAGRGSAATSLLLPRAELPACHPVSKVLSAKSAQQMTGCGGSAAPAPSPIRGRENIDFLKGGRVE